MAQTQPFSPALQASVAQQIGDALGGSSLGGPGNTPAQVGESLDIWMLGASDVPTQKPLSEVADRLGRWHHQIYQGQASVGYAASVPSDDGTNVVVSEVSDSPVLGSLVEQALRSLDVAFPADVYQVSLLQAPAFRVTALWVRSNADSRVCVLQSGAPTLAASNVVSTDPAALTYAEADFLSRLSQVPVIQGLV